MKTLPYFLLLALLLTQIFSSLTDEVSGDTSTDIEIENAACYENGCRYNIQGWIYLHIEGEAYERGYQHGHLLHKEIIDMIQRWGNVIHNAPLISSFTNITSSRYEKISQRWWDFCKSRVVKMYKNYPEEYQQEIKGIVDGVSDRGGKIYGKTITYEDILTLNEMYEFMTKLENPQRRFHPLRSFFNSLKQIVPGLSEEDETAFISSFLNQPKAHHCSGFMATGDATTNGQVVAADGVRCGNWWYSYYIAQRWNVILDIQPDRGNRVIMATSPGYIWSDENYYQNSEGIILIDTTCPQGLWKKKGFPLAIRSRKAAQYSNSIDDAIHYLMDGSDGIWTAVWLIGDTKMGEIARLDLGLYNHKIWRTKNGFYWSANNAMAPSVRAEIAGFGLKGFALRVANYLFNMTTYYEFFTRKYIPAERDIKFEELGEKYYGEIDVEKVKEIMSTYPICDNQSTDCKITDTKLVENNGLWAFFGYLTGKEWNVSHLKKNLKGVRDVPPAGWVRIYGIPSDCDYRPIFQRDGRFEEASILWECSTGEEKNTYVASGIVSNDRLYMATSSGMVYALNSSNGNLWWNQFVGEKTFAPAVHDDLIFVGSENGLYAIKDGEVEWKRSIGCISKPVIAGDEVVIGNENGVYAFEASNGKEKWNIEIPSAYPSSWKNEVCAASGNKCYFIKEGKVEWVYETNGEITSPPLIDRAIYIGSWDGKLYSLDKKGNLKWEQTTGWGIDSTPAIANGIVYAGSQDNNFYAFDAETGEIEWLFTCRSGIHSSPIVYGEYVFFGSDDGQFYALNATNGEPAWKFIPGYTSNGIYNYITTPILSNPTAQDGRVFIGAVGKIYALDAKTIESLASQEYQAFPSTMLFSIVFPIAVLSFIAFYFYRKRI